MNWNKYHGLRCKVKWDYEKTWTKGRLSVIKGSRHYGLYICHDNPDRTGSPTLNRFQFKYSWVIVDKEGVIKSGMDPETGITAFKLLNKVRYDL